MAMASSTDIFGMIASHQRLWQLFVTLVPNIDVNTILDLNEHLSLNINENIT